MNPFYPKMRIIEKYKSEYNETSRFGKMFCQKIDGDLFLSLKIGKKKKRKRKRPGGGTETSGYKNVCQTILC